MDEMQKREDHYPVIQRRIYAVTPAFVGVPGVKVAMGIDAFVMIVILPCGLAFSSPTSPLSFTVM